MKKTIFLTILALVVLLMGLAAPVSANKAQLIEAIASDANLAVSGTGSLYEKINSDEVGTEDLVIDERELTTGVDWDFRIFGPGDAHYGSAMRSAVIKEILKDGADGKSFFDVFDELPVDPEAVDSFFDVFTEMSIDPPKTVVICPPGVAINGCPDVRDIPQSAAYIKFDGVRGESFSLPGAKIHETKNGKAIWKPPIGHVDHGKSISKHKARTGRNPQTGLTPWKHHDLQGVIRFKAGADLAKTVA